MRILLICLAIIIYSPAVKIYCRRHHMRYSSASHKDYRLVLSIPAYCAATFHLLLQSCNICRVSFVTLRLWTISKPHRKHFVSTTDWSDTVVDCFVFAFRFCIRHHWIVFRGCYAIEIIVLLWLLHVLLLPTQFHDPAIAEKLGN